jgi:hypothetical protein
MNPQLILDLVDVAISLAQSQMDRAGTKQALLSIVRMSIRAYEDHVGAPLDTSLIKAEEPV